jgi:hypothetical protein
MKENISLAEWSIVRGARGATAEKAKDRKRQSTRSK